MTSALIRIWVFLAAAALSIHLGGYPLFDADEGRNAEVGREMAATNDYVMPRLDGMPYLDKPIVYFAAEAAAMEILGPTELAARLPAYLFTLLTAAAVAWFARRLWGSEEGWIAAGVLLTIPVTLAFARTVIFDGVLTFFIVVAIIAFYFAIEEGERWNLAAWIAIGLGILTKGPVAIAVPLLVAIPYAIRRKRFRAIWSVAGIIASALVVAPWVWAISREVPDFLRYVVVTETAQRLATSALKRGGPPWYFVPYLIGGAMPWSIAAMFGIRDARRDDRMAFLLLWLAVPFLFFSLSQSKRPQYILPLMPAVALLAASFWREERRVMALRVAAVVLVVLGVAFAVAPLLAHPKMRSDLAAVVSDVAIPLGMCTAVAGAVALLFARRSEVALVVLSIPAMSIPLLTNPLMRAIAERRSTEAFVAQLRPYLKPQTEVIGIEAFTGSMAFYLRRPVIVATPDAEEFTSNYLIRHYASFVDRPSSAVRSLGWLQRALDECCMPRIYVVRNDDGVRRALLESHGMRMIASGAHHVAYTGEGMRHE